MANATNKSWSKYFLDLPPRSEVKKRYKEKISLAGFSKNPYCCLEMKGKGSSAVVSVEWTNWPDIYNYLILTPGVTQAYKSLEGYNFYVNGKVSNLVVTEVSGTKNYSKNYLFTAVVKHSQALSIPPSKVCGSGTSSAFVSCFL